MDPQMRKLLEVTHEAFVDSGIDYKALRGSPRVGVYLGCCGSEVHAMWLSDYNNITGYEQTGCTLSMFANRLSFFFDFKGPSKAVDTGVKSFSPSYFKILNFEQTVFCRIIRLETSFYALLGQWSVSRLSWVCRHAYLLMHVKIADNIMVLCAACSSAFMALHDAVVDLQRGRVDYAVIGGSSAIFRPATSLAFYRLK
jgi:acyl transferase domain-containing protein